MTTESTLTEKNNAISIMQYKNSSAGGRWVIGTHTHCHCWQLGWPYLMTKLTFGAKRQDLQVDSCWLLNFWIRDFACSLSQQTAVSDHTINLRGFTYGKYPYLEYPPEKLRLSPRTGDHLFPRTHDVACDQCSYKYEQPLNSIVFPIQQLYCSNNSS
jgi:hypothetical protein